MKVDPHGQRAAAGGQDRGTPSGHASSSLAGQNIPEAEIHFTPGHRPGPAKGVKLVAFLLAVLVLAAAGYFFTAGRISRTAGPLAMEGAKEAVLYFAAADGNGFAQKAVKLAAEAGDLPGRVRALLAAMTAKPADPLHPTLWPLALSVRSAYLVKNGILILDLDPIRPYNQMLGAAGELQLIRSLVRTLTAYFENVRSVKFLVNGFEQETLAGHVDITRPLSNEDLEQ